MLTRLRALYLSAAIEAWKSTTVDRLTRMAELGATEARVTVGGKVRPEMIGLALREGGLAHTRLDDGDYIVNWAEPTHVPYPGPPWVMIAWTLNARAQAVHPPVSRVEAAEKLVMQVWRDPAPLRPMLISLCRKSSARPRMLPPIATTGPITCTAIATYPSRASWSC